MKKYSDVLDTLFAHCENKTVLELGSFAGHFTKEIIKHKPKNVLSVEPNTQVAPLNANTFIGTANDFYKVNKTEFDVVVCMGLFYHLHSPIHLLEQIINISKPKTLIIETCNGNKLNKEEYNVSGNAFSDKGVSNPLQFNFGLHEKDFTMILESVGYVQTLQYECYDDIDLTDWESSKQHCWSGVYEKN
tara:strand:+ start:1256 stop:1822 length:567 start_codon:yes stop_codon:yes gene_type:complete